MTKSFLEIAQEIAAMAERMGVPPDAHCDGCDGEDCDGNLFTIEEFRLSRDCELAIEAILRREFGDNNGPALERPIGSVAASEAQITEK